MASIRSAFTHSFFRGLFARLFFLGAALWVMSIAASFAQGQMAAANRGIILEINGPIGPATSDYIVTELAQANIEGAGLVLIEMDTPGGLDTSMREIIQEILASDVPVATWVGPSGARAASAGLYILVASHVAAMAPGTNTGAATPVQVGGTPSPLPKPGETADDAEEEGDASEGKAEKESESTPAKAKEKDNKVPALGNEDALRAKVINDASAYIRSLAEMRGRNKDWAEEAVREASSLAAGAALEANVIDVVAASPAALLAEIDGREVTLGDGETVTLSTQGMVLERVEPGWLTKFLSFISNPNVAFIFMSLGTTGIIIEMWNPGAIFPGTLGVVSLIIGLYSFQVLPVNWAGAALIAIGIVLIIAEAWTPSMGVLGFFGLVLFVTGSLLMFPSDMPGFTLSRTVVFSVAGVLTLFLGAILFAVAETRHRGAIVGEESMVGKPVVVDAWDGDEGRVFMDGELWSARSTTPKTVGDKLEIIDVDGLTLVV